MHDVTAPILCATCELEIRGSPTIYQGRPYCCVGCAEGGPCCCSYDPEPSGDVGVPARSRRTTADQAG